MDSFEQAVADEMRRRGLAVKATCKYCKESIEGDYETILAHREICNGPDRLRRVDEV